MKSSYNSINNTSPMLGWEEALDYLTGINGFILRVEVFWRGKDLKLATIIDFSHIWCLNSNHAKAKFQIGLKGCPTSQLFRIQH